MRNASPGRSKYSLYSLIRLNFDLITGFSVVPLQLFSMVGMTVAHVLRAVRAVLFVRRIVVGPEAEGVFTLFALRVLPDRRGAVRHRPAGEYVGRIYAQVRERPRYIVEAVLEDDGAEAAASIPAAASPQRGQAVLAVTRAVVFAYSEVGVRCVRELLAQGVEIPLLFTHADDPGENQLVRQRAAAGRGAWRCGSRRRTTPNTPEWIARGRGREARFSVLILLPPHAG